jgi:hypothetical protein
MLSDKNITIDGHAVCDKVTFSAVYKKGDFYSLKMPGK